MEDTVLLDLLQKLGSNIVGDKRLPIGVGECLGVRGVIGGSGDDTEKSWMTKTSGTLLLARDVLRDAISNVLVSPLTQQI